MSRHSKRFLLLLIAGFLVMGGHNSLAQPGDPFEPNNTREQAAEIELPFVAQTLSIAPRTDQDYFVFTISKPAFVNIDIDAESLGSRLDAVLFILDEDGDSIALSDDSDGSDPGLQIRLGAGRYFAVVTGFLGLSIGVYNITIEMQDLGDCLDSELPQQGAETWSLGLVEPGSHIQVFLNGPAQTDFDLFLIELISNNPPLSATVASGQSQASDESASYDVKGLRAREFLIRVEAFEGEGVYTLCRKITGGGE